MQTHRPARAWAGDLVEAWLDHRPHDDIINQVPEWQRDMVLKMARGSCSIIASHAKQVYSGTKTIDDIPRKLQDTVLRRVKTMHRIKK